MSIGKNGSKMMAFGLALALLLLPLLPQEEQLSLAEQAKIDARRDAKADQNSKDGIFFYALGFASPLLGWTANTMTGSHFSPVLFSVPQILCLGWAGFGNAPSPSLSRLRDMPTEYAETYLQQYRKTFKSRRLGQAALGWLGMLIVGSILLAATFDID